MEKKEVEAYSWIARGSLRRAVIRALEKPRIVSDIYKEAKNYNPLISLNNTSDTLRDFEKMKIATCINPKEKVGRIYKLTLLGEKIRKEL
ncbi:MAG: hypothetical protein WC595_00870 [Candidatus Nanoarchaeia archaeon]